MNEKNSSHRETHNASFYSQIFLCIKGHQTWASVMLHEVERWLNSDTLVVCVTVLCIILFETLALGKFLSQNDANAGINPVQ